MWRFAFAAAAAVLLAVPEAEAQSRSWVPWGEINAAPAPRYNAQPRGASAQRGAVRGATPARAPVQRGWLDDDEDDGSVFASRGGQMPAPRSVVQFPKLLDGGGRPAIAASAPPQVRFAGYATGSIVVDTAGRALYYVTSPTTALRYPISVGREGFTWRGTEKISRVQDWPDWHPPAEMRQRDPKLPEKMTGGVNNPLGAKALYLGNTLYRIHGTNDSRSIGYAASSGCFRMMNSHVMHLAGLAGVGTTVHVVDRLPRNVASLN